MGDTNYIIFAFRKVGYIFKEMFYMVKRHKVLFLLPLLILLAILAIFIIYIGPTVITTFIYAGV